MTFLALVFALLADQLRPVPGERWVLDPLDRLCDRIRQLHDHGDRPSAHLYWWLAVLGATIGSALVYGALVAVHSLLGFAFNIAVLYLVLGYRRETGYFSDIHLALGTGDIERARTLVGQWRGADHGESSSSELARLAIEEGLVRTHRSVFGAVFWFVVLPGPCGAVMYRVAESVARNWVRASDREADASEAFAPRAFALLDWLPARTTAMAYAIIGNFEDAMYCWRTQSMLWTDKASGILIASGAGALGVRLGLPIHVSGTIIDRPEMGLGSKADLMYMQSAAKLAWRVLVLYLLVLALLGIAGWVGG